MDNVVITGIGIISALGNGVKSNFDSLKRGTSGIGHMDFLDTAHKEFPIGEVRYSSLELKKNLGLSTDGPVPRTTALSVAAVREALITGCTDVNMVTNKVKFITGTTTGGIDITEDVYFDMVARKEVTKYAEYQSARFSTLATARRAGMKKKTITVSTACSSAMNAIILGARLLRSGREDMVLAGGSEALTKFHFNGFRSLRIMDQRQCRPFSRDRGGLNLGEGAAYVLMERESDAKRRGVRILAYITGFGNKCDAFHQTTTSADGQGAYLAMTEALESAGLQPSQISYINAHGTGTHDNDLSESIAIKRVFGEKYPPVSSTKGFTGHTTSASGAIETVFCILAMRGGFIPSNLGWRCPMENGFAPTKGRAQARLDHIMCNSFGFGGNDSSLIISSKPTNSWKKLPKVDIETIYGRELDEEEALRRIGQYVPQMQIRRMGRIMKAATITSMEILKEHGIQKPDAIIGTTANGMLENFEQFMQDIRHNGEENPKPSLFMQSTYNTVSSSIAIATECHGYNMTYCDVDLDAAMEDARMLIEEGKADNVLVGRYEETTDFYRHAMGKFDEMGRGEPKTRQRIYSQSILIRRKKRDV